MNGRQGDADGLPREQGPHRARPGSGPEATLFWGEGGAVVGMDRGEGRA